MNLRYVREWSRTFFNIYSERYIVKKAILGLAMIGLIAPASLQAEENASCGWLHYAAGGLTVAGAAVTNGVFLLSTAVSTTTSGFMFCDWWGAMFALQQEQIIYVAYNHSSILEEATRGSGPHVEALATLHGCPMKAQIEFGSMLQQSFTDNTEVFFDYNQSPAHTRDFLELLRQGIQQHPLLSQECRPTG